MGSREIDTVLKLKVRRLRTPAPDILGKGAPSKRGREGNGLASTEERGRNAGEGGRSKETCAPLQRQWKPTVLCVFQL